MDERDFDGMGLELDNRGQRATCGICRDCAHGAHDIEGPTVMHLLHEPRHPLGYHLDDPQVDAIMSTTANEGV